MRARLAPEVDIHGRAFTERDKKLLDLLLRPGGASLERINRSMPKTAYSYSKDSERLAERLGAISWSNGEGSTRRSGYDCTRGEMASSAPVSAQTRDVANLSKVFRNTINAGQRTTLYSVTVGSVDRG
jgi:hypothetical protein